MDNNNPAAPVPPPMAANPGVPTPVEPTPVPAAPTPPASGGSKKVILLVIGLAIIAVAVAGFYYYSISQTKEQEAVQKAAADELITLESELNQVSIEEADSELSAIDQDLQSL